MTMIKYRKFIPCFLIYAKNTLKLLYTAENCTVTPFMIGTAIKINIRSRQCTKYSNQTTRLINWDEAAKNQTDHYWDDAYIPQLIEHRDEQENE